MPHQGWRTQSVLLFTHSWRGNNWIHIFPQDISARWIAISLGFELVSPCPFPTTITITPRAPPNNLVHIIINIRSNADNFPSQTRKKWLLKTIVIGWNSEKIHEKQYNKCVELPDEYIECTFYGSSSVLIFFTCFTPLYPNLISIHPQINQLNIKLQNATNLLVFNTAKHKYKSNINSWNIFMGRMSLEGTEKNTNMKLQVSEFKLQTTMFKVLLCFVNNAHD